MCLVGGRRRQIVVHGTDPLSKELEDLQLTLGEGPCMQAVRTGSPVAAPDLVEAAAVAWPSFAEQAVARGVRALFSYPLRVSYPVRGGTVHLGVLDLYRHSPGPLTESQQLDAVLLTDTASRAMLAQKDRASLDRSVSALRWLTGEERLTGTGRGRAVDLGITVEQALAPNRPDGGDDVLRSATDP